MRDAVFAGFCEDSTGVASLLATDFRQWCIQLSAKDGLCLLSGVDAGLTVSKQNQMSHVQNQISQVGEVAVRVWCV